jgi:hypothetical protein
MRALLAGAAVVVLTGCGQGTVAQKDLPSASASPLPTPQLASASPNAVNRSCIPDGAQPSPPAYLPPDAICVSSARGNFDGLSGNESVTTYSLRGAQESKAPRPWYVQVDLGSGRTLSVDLKTLFRNPGDVFVIGAADAKGDGRDVAFIVLGTGASTDLVGILGIDGSQLALASPPSPPGGFAYGGYVFTLGGSVMHQGMLQCTGSGVSARLIESGWGSSDGGKTFAWESTTYRWSGMHLDPVGRRSGSANSWDDPQKIALGGGLNCDGLTGL